MTDRASALQRFTRDATAAAPSAPSLLPDATASEDVHPSKAYGGLWSRRDLAHTLEFRPLDATAAAEALEYSYLARVQWDAAKGVITLHYQPLGVVVTISGLGLFDMKEKLRQHLVTWIQEQGADPIKMQGAKRAMGQDFIWVQQIRIDERAEQS
jgi:hypothetical protein